MTRTEFIRGLDEALQEMDYEDRKNILNYYEELIDDCMEAGMTEEEAVNAMEPIQVIANRTLEEYREQQKQDTEGQTGDKEIHRELSTVTALRVKAVSQKVIVRSGDQDDLVMRYHIDTGDIYRLHEEDGVLTLEHKRRPITSFVHESGDAFSAIKGVLDSVGSFLSSLDWGSLMGTSLTSRTIEIVLPRAFRGDVHVVTSNSRISAEDLTLDGRLTLETSNAGITLCNSLARGIELSTSNGRAELDAVTAQESLRAMTSNACITAEHVTAGEELILNTSNGRVTLDGIFADSIHIRNSNGPVTGTVIGEEADFTISSATSNAANALGSHGNGPRVLRVHTSNGPIEVSFIQQI